VGWDLGVQEVVFRQVLVLLLLYGGEKKFE
jgi:hypothetical protein